LGGSLRVRHEATRLQPAPRPYHRRRATGTRCLTLPGYVPRLRAERGPFLENSETQILTRSTAAPRFSAWKLFFSLVVIAVSAAVGAVFGVVRWIGRDLPSPE